jgi:hypothetical protein
MCRTIAPFGSRLFHGALSSKVSRYSKAHRSKASSCSTPTRRLLPSPGSSSRRPPAVEGADAIHTELGGGLSGSSRSRSRSRGHRALSPIPTRPDAHGQQYAHNERVGGDSVTQRRASFDQSIGIRCRTPQLLTSRTVGSRRLRLETSCSNGRAASGREGGPSRGNRDNNEPLTPTRGKLCCHPFALPQQHQVLHEAFWGYAEEGRPPPTERRRQRVQRHPPTAFGSTRLSRSGRSAT